MSKKKLTISLDVDLDKKQQKRLHAALHRAVSAQLKKIEQEKKESKAVPKVAKDKKEKATKTAVLEVTIINAGIESEVKAILHGEEHTLTQSGKIRFSKVNTGDIIKVRGTSLGSVTVTIDIDADPTQLNFQPGIFLDEFEIK